MRVEHHVRPVAAAEGAIAGRCVSFRILLPHRLGKAPPAVIAVFFQGGVAVVELGLAAAVAVVLFIGIKIARESRIQSHFSHRVMIWMQ